MPFVKARDHGLLDFDWDPAVTIPLVQTRAHGHAIAMPADISMNPKKSRNSCSP